MVDLKEQAEVKAFIRTLVTQTIMSTGEPGVGTDAFPLTSWVDRSIKEKMNLDLPLVYHRGTNEQPNFRQKERVGSSTYDLTLPKISTGVNWHTDRKKRIEIRRSAGDPPNLVPHVPGEVETVIDVHIPWDSNKASDVWAQMSSSSAPAEETASRHRFVKDLATMTITRSSTRDRQQMPGPSDLSNTCDLCVARKIASMFGISHDTVPDSFSLKAWIGTSIHQKLERDLPNFYPIGDKESPNFYQEVTTTVSEIPDLGTIKGHVDLYLPKLGTVVDYKTADLKRINMYKGTSVPASHAGQTMLYLRGLRASGHRAHTAVLVYIPRDSNDLTDIWVVSCAYQNQIAEGLLKRTQNLVKMVRSGDTGNLVSNPDCFVCNVQPKLAR